MKYREEILLVVVGALLIFAFFTDIAQSQEGLDPGGLLCAAEPGYSNGNSISGDYDRLDTPDGQIIAKVVVKAGQGCLIPDGICYAVTAGGIGYDFVIVERVGDPGPDCQDISHLEVEYAQDPPTFTPTEPGDTPTPGDTATPTETDVSPTDTPGIPTSTPTDDLGETPTPTSTEIYTPTDDPETDTPTPEEPTGTPSPAPTPTEDLYPSPTPCSPVHCGLG